MAQDPQLTVRPPRKRSLPKDQPKGEVRPLTVSFLPVVGWASHDTKSSGHALRTRSDIIVLILLGEVRPLTRHFLLLVGLASYPETRPLDQ